MSQENVEVVRASFDVWNTGDMDAYGEQLTPMHGAPASAVAGAGAVCCGRERLCGFFEPVRDASDADLTEPISDFVDADDRVVRFAWSVRGRGPAAIVEISAVALVRDGKISGFECFWDHAEALEAVGLSE